MVAMVYSSSVVSYMCTLEGCHDSIRELKIRPNDYLGGGFRRRFYWAGDICTAEGGAIVPSIFQRYHQASVRTGHVLGVILPNFKRGLATHHYVAYRGRSLLPSDVGAAAEGS